MSSSISSPSHLLRKKAQDCSIFFHTSTLCLRAKLACSGALLHFGDSKHADSAYLLGADFHEDDVGSQS